MNLNLAIVQRCLTIFMIAKGLIGFPLSAAGTCQDFSLRSPWIDTLSQQAKDSMLFHLNLEYLNGVNDHQSPFELIPIIEGILSLDSGMHNHWFNLGIENMKIHEYERAIEALNRGREFYPSDDNLTLLQIYLNLSYCYNQTGQNLLEKDILDFASSIFPDHPAIIGKYVIFAHSRVRYNQADYHLERLVLILRSGGMDESDIAYYLGRLFLNTDYLVAEKHFRSALQYDPDNVEKQGALAWVLIQNALKIDEGMALIEKVIEADPDNAVFLHQQGYGYYAKGKFEDALSILYQARSFYKQYSYELYNHIQMVEEAIASIEE